MDTPILGFLRAGGRFINPQRSTEKPSLCRSLSFLFGARVPQGRQLIIFLTHLRVKAKDSCKVGFERKTSKDLMVGIPP